METTRATTMLGKISRRPFFTCSSTILSPLEQETMTKVMMSLAHM